MTLFSAVIKKDLVSLFWFAVIILLWRVFTPALANDFSLEFEWQQVFSSLQDFLLVLIML